MTALRPGGAFAVVCAPDEDVESAQMDLLIGGFVGGGAGATDGALAGLAQVSQSGTCETSNGGILTLSFWFDI